jgi:hypothetical protein
MMKGTFSQKILPRYFHLNTFIFHNHSHCSTLPPVGLPNSSTTKCPNLAINSRSAFSCIHQDLPRYRRSLM